MADDLEIKTGDLSVSLRWIDSAGGATPALANTLARVGIGLRDTYATAYKSDKGDVGDKVEVPAYTFAEWLVSNWWALLFEPRKSESDDESGFMSRHWVGAARGGFALPDLWIVPTGDQVEFNSREAYLRFARLTFTEEISCEVPRQDVQSVLSRFVNEVVERLQHRRVEGTLVQELWSLISNTRADEELYCQLIGSLGLNPYDDNSVVDQILDDISGLMSPSALMDLCHASDENSLRRSAAIAAGAYDSLKDAKPFSVAGLQSAFRAPANDGAPAWRVGVEATHRLRQAIGVSANDPDGGEALFDRLGIDCATDDDLVTTEQTDFAGVSGALDPRETAEIRLSLVERRESQRRFTAARSVFLALDRKASVDRRLITVARTRDQQASRAFAAELLAPIRHIRSRAGGRAISSYRVQEIANELNVSPWVVGYQARNNGLHVIDAY